MSEDLIQESQVRAELRRIAASESFAESPRLVQLLEYLVEEVLAGRSTQIKAYAIAIDVFGRQDSFDPASDSIVRVQAKRLREALARFYEQYGRGELTIVLPKGSYVPGFEQVAADSDSVAGERQGWARAAPLNGLWAAWRSGSVRRQIGHWLSGAQRVAARTGQLRVSLVGALCVGIGLAVVAYSLGAQGESGSGRDAAINSIGLVPFGTTSSEPRQLALADSVGNEIASILASARDFSIKIGPKGRSTELSGLEVQRHASELGVRWVLSGRMLEIDAKAQLDVMLMDGLKGNLVWSNSFAIDSLREARTVAVEILLENRPHLFAAMRRALEEQGARASNPVDLFIMANWAWGARHSSLKWEQERIELARAAIARDPTFGPAYAVLADKLAFLATVDRGWRSPALAAEASASALKAIEYSAHSSEATFNLALHYWHSGNPEEARAHFARTLELNEGHVAASLLHKRLQAVCRHDDKILQDLERFDRDLPAATPIRWVSQAALLHHHVLAGNVAAAIEAGRKSVREFSNPEVVLWLAAALAQAGKPEKAIDLIQQERRNWPGLDVVDYVKSGLNRRCGGEPPAEVKRFFLPLTRVVQQG